MSMQTKPIKPIGLRILDHHKLGKWIDQGYASQESDGLWLHYIVICTLLHEAYSDGETFCTAHTQVYKRVQLLEIELFEKNQEIERLQQQLKTKKD